MKHFFSALIIALFSILSINAAHAATYKIDPSHTRVIYFVNHMGFSNFMGHFNNVTGTILFNTDKIETSKVDVSIDAKSVSMDNLELDTKLQDKDFFNTSEFPTIIFKSTDIEKTGPVTARMNGTVTLLGVTKPVTLEVKMNHKGFNKFAGAASVGFTATGKIRRSDFGLKAYLPVVGDVVNLRIEAEAHANSGSVEK